MKLLTRTLTFPLSRAASRLTVIERSIAMNEYIGKRMTWEELQSTFPDSFVALDDYKDNGTTVSGILMFQTKKKEVLWNFLAEYAKNNKKKLKHLYTTESMELNGLWQI